jgi:hypothetical protein
MTRSSDGNHPIGSDENPMNIANVEVTGQRPKLPAIIPEFDFYLPPEGRPIVHEEENDEGGVGGGSGGPGSSSSSNDEEEDKDDDEEDEKSLTEMLFRNDSLPNELEIMLKHILGTCMGEKLINALASEEQLSITFNPNADKPGSYNPGSRNITLRGFNNDVLFHEMFHAYQDNVSSGGLNINSDIEAYVAQYRYLEKLAFSDMNAFELLSTRYEHGFYQIIAVMSEKTISSNGMSLLIDPIEFELRYLGAAFILQNKYKEDGVDMEIDPAPSFDQNFKNLQQLSKGC